LLPPFIFFYNDERKDAAAAVSNSLYCWQLKPYAVLTEKLVSTPFQVSTVASNDGDTEFET